MVQPGCLPAHRNSSPRVSSPVEPRDRLRASDWLSAPVAWVPQPGPEYGRILRELITGANARGNLVPDAMLAALAIEHGLTLHSTDTDFARFRGLRWTNPLDAGADSPPPAIS